MTGYLSTCVLHNTDSPLNITYFSVYNCPFSNIHYQVFAICCLLCIVYYSRFTIRDSLVNIAYLSCTSAIIYSVVTIRECLFTMSALLLNFIIRIFTIYHSLLVITRSKFTTQYALFNMHYLRFTLHRVPCTLYDVITYCSLLTT